MSTTPLQDLIGSIKNKHQDAYERGQTSEGPDSAFDGPDMPLTQEYRATIDKGEYKPSKAGNLQFVVTYEIQEPVEFKGRKVQAYQNPIPRDERDAESLAKWFGVYSANLDGWGEDMEGFIKQFEGKSAVIALRKWGTESDRYGVRWENADRGQSLRTNLTPLKPKTDTKNLRPDIQIDKERDGEPFPAPPGGGGGTLPPPPQAPVTPPTTGGPNLPPGLQG